MRQPVGVKIGLLGGSFDPVHCGHLAAAHDARLALGLDRVLLIPAAQAPLKPGNVCASAKDRLAMLACAIEGEPGLEICDLEVRRGGINYSIDTVRELRNIYPQAGFFWIIGADHLATLARWWEAEALAREVVFACLERPGHGFIRPEGVPGLRIVPVRGSRIDVSSTRLRDMAAAGESLAGLVPHKTIEYIGKNRLYRGRMPIPSRKEPTLELLKKLAKALADKKADGLCVLRVSAQSDITDYLVLATGNSEPHLRALRIETERIFDEAKVPIAGMDSGGYGSGWTVVDAYQIMVHLFTQEQRRNYALEKLWKDAELVDLDQLTAVASAPVRVKKQAAVSKAKVKGKGKAKTVAKTAVAKKKSVAAKVKAPAKPAAKKKAPAKAKARKKA